jgi:pimeloyl-ACP methyl ester carboxylesterase
MTTNPTRRRIYARQPVRTKRRIFVASRRVKAGLICLCFLGIWKQSVAQTSASPIKNIVLVHGAWVDGSGWKPVYDILTKDGYTVTLVQEPLTSFAEDVRATRRVLDQQSGPCILVGHSYGGSIITEAGTDPHVVGLVYIAAHMPDTGESEAADGKRYPSAVSDANVIEKSSDGFIYLTRAEFPKYFAGYGWTTTQTDAIDHDDLPSLTGLRVADWNWTTRSKF